MADVRYVLGLDPGPAESALVEYDAEARAVLVHRKAPNEHVRATMLPLLVVRCPPGVLVIETPHARGGIERQAVMDTCIEVGRVVEVWRRLAGDAHHIWRETVKRAILGSAKGTDAQVRAALLDRWGGVSAIGRKASPGPLYGLRGDEWAALAVAVAWADAHVPGHAPESGGALHGRPRVYDGGGS